MPVYNSSTLYYSPDPCRLKSAMSKKTGMSDSSLWIVAVVLLVLAAWMYLKR